MQFRTALSGENLERLSVLAERSSAVLAINADDYNVHKYGTIIRNGELLRIHDTTRSMLIVDANGVFTVLADRAGENPEELRALASFAAVLTGALPAALLCLCATYGLS